MAVSRNDNGGALPAHAFLCFETINASLTGDAAMSPAFDETEEYPLFVTWNILSRNSSKVRLRGCIGNFEAMPLGTGLKDYATISAFKDHRFDPITAKELHRLQCGVSLLTDFELCDSYLDWTLGTHGIYIQFPNPALTPPGPISTPSSSTPDSTASDSATSASNSTTSLPLAPSHPRQTFRSFSKLPSFSVPKHPNPRRLPTTLTATYLPDVPGAQGWSKLETLDSAIRKAGWSGKITEGVRKSIRVTRYQSKQVEVTWAEWQAWRERAHAEGQ